MKYALLTLTATISCDARVCKRQGLGNCTSATTSLSANTNVPANIAIADLASATTATNSTSSRSSSATPTAVPSCCYIYPKGVGINTWWTSSVDLTVATVITTWLQYNNTVVPGNVTTKTVVNATEIFGAHGVQSLDYTLQPVSATATKTDWVCGGWAPFSSGNAPCTSTIWTTRTDSAVSTVYYNTSNVLSGVPNTLLPAAAVLYGKTSIDSTTATTFPSQSLVIEAPSPYYFFSGIDIFTSATCMETQTTTDYTSYGYTTINGAATQVSGVYPIATVTAFGVSWPIHAGRSGNLYLNYTLAKPFPDGDYSDFNFTDWAKGITMGPAPGPVDAYMFRLPDDFPQFLAGIPEILSEYPEVASCTNFAGDGEPTVHIPVNQLTDTSHVTMTMNGPLRPSAGSPKPEPQVTTTTNGTPHMIPVIETTADELQTPGPEMTTSPVVARPGTTLDVPSDSRPPIAFTPVTGHSQDELATPSPEPSVSATLRTPQIVKPDSALATPNAPAQQTTQNVGDVIASVIGLGPRPVQIPAEDVPSFVYAPRPTITIGGSAVGGNDKTEFIIGDQTLKPGGAAVTDGENVIQLPAEPTAVIVNGNESPIADARALNNIPAPVYTFGDNTITANAASQFIIASHTLTPGGDAVTIAGTVLSVESGASVIVVNGHTSVLAVPVGAPLTVGRELATPIAGGAYLLPGDNTLSPGASGVVLAGTTYSLAENGHSVVVNGVTSAILQPGSQEPGGLTELALPGTTLRPGHEAVISGTTYSLPAAGEGIFINGQPTQLPRARPGSQITLPNGVVATQTVVSDVMIGSQTLVPGGSAITVSGTTYSARGSEVVVEASGSTRIAELDEFESSLTASHSSATSSRWSSRSSATRTQVETAPVPVSTGGTAVIRQSRQLTTIALVVAVAVFMM